MVLTPETATAKQVEHHIERLSLDIRYYHELIELAPDSAEAPGYRAKLAHLQRSLNYFLRLYQQKGGKDMLVDMPAAHVTATPPQVAQQRAQQKARAEMSALLGRCQSALREVSGSLAEARRRTREDWVIDMLFYQSGGFSATTLMLAESRGIKPAEVALKSARQKANQGDFQGAVAHLRIFEQKLGLAASAVNAYYDALEVGGKRIEVAIKIGASIGTGLTVAGAGLQLTTAQEIGLAMVQTGSQEFGQLGWNAALGGPQTSWSDVGKAALETAKAGGTTWVGEWAKSAVAPKVAGLLFKNPNYVQSKNVEAAVAEYFKANSGLAIDAFTDLANGKTPDYKWWASLVGPALSAADSRLGAGDSAAGEVKKSEEEVAKMLEERGRARK